MRSCDDRSDQPLNYPQLSVPHSEVHLFLVNRQNLHDSPYLSANKEKINLANMSQSPFAN